MEINNIIKECIENETKMSFSDIVNTDIRDIEESLRINYDYENSKFFSARGSIYFTQNLFMKLFGK